MRSEVTGRPRTLALLALVAAAATARTQAASAEELHPTFHGGWVATAGATVFRGRWSAELLAGQPDEARGSWTLLGAGEAVVLEGTWAARRSGRGWTGAWSARTQAGGFFTGSWRADGKGLRGKRFADLLASAAETRISGTWQMRGARGQWWLEGAR